MNIQGAIRVLTLCAKNNLPVIMSGAPGVGKSDIVALVAKNIEADCIISHPVTGEPTDVKGLPFPDETKTFARFLPYGDLERAIKAKKKTIWFLDDFGHALPAVQASYMQLLLARQIGEHKISDFVTFVLATNLKQHRAGTHGFIEPVKSRFSTIINLKPTLQEWTPWAWEHNVPAEIISYLMFKPDDFIVENPTLELTNSPSPRTWANLGKLQTAGVHPDDELEVFSGAIGAAVATEYQSFLNLSRECPAPETLLLSPSSASIPEDISILYALGNAVAHHVTPENFANLMVYTDRIGAMGKQELSAFFIRNAIRRCPNAQQTSAFTRVASGPLGPLFA
ncbi:ATP-binding protein [Nostoc sp. CHAB 5834]|nr:ATP-binding protein [Nostoc sp. CHAB 5834]